MGTEAPVEALVEAKAEVVVEVKAEEVVEVKAEEVVVEVMAKDSAGAEVTFAAEAVEIVVVAGGTIPAGGIMPVGGTMPAGGAIAVAGGTLVAAEGTMVVDEEVVAIEEAIEVEEAEVDEVVEDLMLQVRWSLSCKLDHKSSCTPGLIDLKVRRGCPRT